MQLAATDPQDLGAPLNTSGAPLKTLGGPQGAVGPHRPHRVLQGAPQGTVGPHRVL